MIAFDTFPNSAHDDDDLDARTRRIHSAILDSIEATLTELATPPLQRAAIDRELLDQARRAAWAQCSPLLCRHARCRRAKACRGKPCTIASARTQHASIPS